VKRDPVLTARTPLEYREALQGHATREESANTAHWPGILRPLEAAHAAGGCNLVTG
jgi:hypothetical protein